VNNQLEHVSAPFQAVLQRLHNWIKDNSNVLLCAILGSQSTANSSRDEWSDIDLVLIVSDTTEFDTQGKWIERLTHYDFIYQDSAEIGEGLLWHVIINQRYMIDLSLFSIEDIEQWQHQSRQSKSSMLGYFKGDPLILIDRMGLYTSLVQNQDISEYISDTENRPSVYTFEKTITEFWYQVLRAIKLVVRNDLWRATTTCNYELKRPFLSLLEWYTKSIHDWSYKTHFRGQMLDNWVAKDIRDEIPATFSTYNRDELVQSIHHTIMLCVKISEHVAKGLDFVSIVEKVEGTKQFALHELQQLQPRED